MTPLVRNRKDVQIIPCPYGDVARIITGGETPIANVHVVSVTEGSAHLHKSYDEVYYVLSGSGVLMMNGETFKLEPNTVAVIPRQTTHALEADEGQTLEFVIFGVPGMSVEDPRFVPQKAI